MKALGDYAVYINKAGKILGLVPMQLASHKAPPQKQGDWYDSTATMRYVRQLRDLVGDDGMRRIGREIIPLISRIEAEVLTDLAVDSAESCILAMPAFYARYHQDGGSLSAQKVGDCEFLIDDNTSYPESLNAGLLEGAVREFGGTHVSITASPQGEGKRRYTVTWTAADVSGSAPSQSSVPSPRASLDLDRVFSTLKAYADTLINEGTDTYGDLHTPMFCFHLDTKTHKPPHRDFNPMCVSFDASYQARCANMDYENDNFRMLFKLSEMTGDKTYADAADAYMSYFMDHCVSPTTGLFAWGEHIYYNLFTEDYNCRGHDGHEFEGYITVWDDLWRLNRAAVQREIEAIHEYHIHDHINYNFDRHAHFHDGHNDGVGFINHGMNYVFCFAFLYKKTKNPEYLEWAIKLTNARYEARDEHGMAPACVVRDSRGSHHTEYICPYAQGGGAGFLTYAYLEHPEPLFIQAASDYFKASFAHSLDEAMRKSQQGEEGGGDLSGFAPGLMNIFEATGDEWFLDKAKAAVAETPKYLYVGGEDWGANEAAMCAVAMSSAIRLHKITREQKWLDLAMSKAQYAIDNLFEGGLFRYVSEGNVSDRYCARGDAPLGLAFAELAEVLKKP